MPLFLHLLTGITGPTEMMKQQRMSPAIVINHQLPQNLCHILVSICISFYLFIHTQSVMLPIHHPPFNSIHYPSASDLLSSIPTFPSISTHFFSLFIYLSYFFSFIPNPQRWTLSITSTHKVQIINSTNLSIVFFQNYFHEHNCLPYLCSFSTHFLHSVFKMFFASLIRHLIFRLTIFHLLIRSSLILNPCVYLPINLAVPLYLFKYIHLL